MSTFARSLSRLRAVRGLTQAALAEKAGLSPNTVASFEQAKKFPRAVTIDRLAAALCEDPKALVGDLLQTREPGPPTWSTEPVLPQLASELDGQPAEVQRLVLAVARAIVREVGVTPP